MKQEQQIKPFVALRKQSLEVFVSFSFPFHIYSPSPFSRFFPPLDGTVPYASLAYPLEWEKMAKERGVDFNLEVTEIQV